MRNKISISISFPPEKMDDFNVIVDRERRSDAATLRVMLEDYMNKTLVPTYVEKVKKHRGAVSTSLDADFKERLYKHLEEQGIKLQKLVEGLIATKLKR